MKQNCTRNSNFPSKYKGNTAVLLIIIVLFAIGAILFLNSSAKEPAGPVEHYPWVETNRIVDDIAAINLPQSPQIRLDAEKTIIHRIASEDGQNRGRLEIVITPEGLVVATWTAKYKEDIYEKEFTATCGGNVDANRLYETENSSTDPSKLFFITEGKFILQAFKHGNATVNGGKAYVVGWISPDGSATGTLVLTPDKKTIKIYRWGS